VARRGAAFISFTTAIAPPGETSAMIWRIEFEPMSITAIGGPWSRRPFGMMAREGLRAFDEAA